jgi:hypothetical protein
MTWKVVPFVMLCLASCAEGGHRHHSKFADDDSEETSSSAEHRREKIDRDRPSDEDDGKNGKLTKVSNATPPEPEFKEGMSVDEAIKAVPPGIERRDIDQETLGKPLQDMSVYEPCKPGSTRVKLRVAVWDGRAVGINVTTTPRNDKLSSCIKGRIAEIKWEKKVRSLNTIEYQL